MPHCFGANPCCWFEISTLDLDRAAKFYEAAFSLQFPPTMQVGPNNFRFFPMEAGKPGAPGALIQGNCIEPSHRGTTIYFGVESIEPALQKIIAAGGKSLMPRTSIGQFGFIAFFEDSEGNRVGLHEQPQM